MKSVGCCRSLLQGHCLTAAAGVFAGLLAFAAGPLQAASITSARSLAAHAAAPTPLGTGTPLWLAPQILEGGAANGIAGFTVATADINGDGYADIVTSQQVYGDSSTTPTTSVLLVYYGSPSGPQLPAQPIADPDSTGFDYFGENVASAGDVNGDGYDDILADDERGGDSGNPNNFDFRGTVYLYLGSAQGLSATPAARLVGDDVDGGKFGFSIATAGDVDGDGFADVVVGENSVNPAQDETVFLYYGSSKGLDESARTRLTVHTQSAAFGFSVRSAGDVNGDGFDDVVVGAPGYEAATLGGGAFVYAGSAQGLATEPMTVLTGDTAYGDFGFAVTGVGDLNGDGYDDLMVGTDCEGTASQACEFFTFPGAAWVFDGGADGPSSQASAKLLLASEDASPASFGIHIEAAGDVNSDGFADVAVSALQYNGLGAVLVYFGPLSSASQPDVELYDADSTFSLYGFRFSMGDVDGDGRRDPVIGAGFYSAPDLDSEGAMYVYPSRNPDVVFADGFDSR